MDQENRTDYFSVHIEGDVSGQIAIGENILQIGDVHGGIVNVIQPGKKPTFKSRQRPVMVRPRRFSGFLDRVTEMDAMVGALNGGEPVAMYAADGMGKTTLLRQLAYDAPGDNFPDGILYMPARINCVEDLLQIIFDHFYESDSPALPTPAELRGFLQELEALIILDDTLLSREDVTELINSLPRSVVVLSSSERCLWGEGRCIELRGLPLEEALKLVEVELGRKVKPSERPFAETLHLLGTGQPLFMIQAAALVREGKSFEEIIAALKGPEESLAHLLAGRLNETQNRILRLLDAFREIAVPKKHLAGLSEAKDLESDLNLLKKLRFVHESGSTVGLASPLILPLSLTQADWETGSFEYFTRWLQAAPSLLEVRESLDLLLFVLGRAVSSGRWDVVIALGKGIERTLILSGLWSTWSQILGWILEAARSLGDKALQAWTLHQLGARSLCLGDLSAAQSFLTQALSLREALGDQTASALTRQVLGTTTAPPTAPFHVHAPHPGMASWSALSPVVKVALLVGGTAVAATAIFLSNFTTHVPPESPESPAVVSHAPVEEPGLIAVTGKTETPILIKTPIWTEMSVPTFTEVPAVIPVQDDCTSTIKFVVARQLQYEASIAFDTPFDVPSENMDNDRNIDMGGKLTVYVNEKEVTDYRTGLYDPTRLDRLFILLPELDLDDNVQIQMLNDEALYCSPVVPVDWIDPYVEPLTGKGEPPTATEEPAHCVPQVCSYGEAWLPDLCCCGWDYGTSSSCGLHK